MDTSPVITINLPPAACDDILIPPADEVNAIAAGSVPCVLVITMVSLVP